MYPLLRPLLFCGDPETVHERSLAWADAAHRLGLAGLAARRPKPLPTRAFGLTFENPVGLAAGMDKNGAHVDALSHLGFGFIEVGTVTPRPQSGNPRPRLFRLPEKQAIINRMGFNNEGVDALVKNLERTRWKGVIGVNIGKNKDTPNDHALRDYLHCLERVWDVAGYIVVNISSPNTAGLRELQHGDPLRAPRLAAATHPEAWPVFAEHAGLELPPATERQFAHVHFALDAAIAGLGAAVVSWPLCAEAVLEGRLVAPLGFRRSETVYALLAAPGAESRALERFRAWLVEEGAKTPEPPL